MPKTTLTIRVDPDLKTAIERIAAADRRSLSSLVEKILAEYVERSKKRKDV